MDMSTNMIAVLGTGSGMNAQTSDSILNLSGSGGLDFQSMLMGMMTDTGSPVSEAFNANSLLTSKLYESIPMQIPIPIGTAAQGLQCTDILTAQTDSDDEQKELPFLQAAELAQLSQSVKPMQESMAATAPEVETAVTEVQTSQPMKSAEPVKLGVETERPQTQEEVKAEPIAKEFEVMKNEKTTTGEAQVNTVEKLRSVQGTHETQQTVNKPDVENAKEVQMLRANRTETPEAAKELKAFETFENVKANADRPTIPEPKSDLAGTFEKTETADITKAAVNREAGEVKSEAIKAAKAQGLERVVPAKTQTADEQQQNFADVSAKHLHEALQSSEMVAESSAPQESAEAYRSRPAYVQVADGVEKAISAGKEEFTMQLKPEGLGEISVKLVREGAKVTISIAAANPETHRMLLSQVDGLVKALGMSNINVDGVQVQNAATAGQDTPVSATNAYDFNSGVDVNKEGAQRENHGSNHSQNAHQFFTNEQEASDEADETVRMLREQMRMMDYLA
jgi:flagellar hook-length control protein FliK